MPEQKKPTRAAAPATIEHCHETIEPIAPPTPAELGLPDKWWEQPERFVDRFKRESICGGTDDSQDVELYDGTLGVTQAFVSARQRPVGQLQWNGNLATIYTNPGNVSGVRWCSGTLISRDLFLTAGHCFDQSAGGWQLPRVNGTGNTIQPAEIATNMHVNFDYQRAPGGTLRVEQSFPVVALVEYRLNGLDFAIVRLGGDPGNTFGWTRVATADAAVGDMIAIIGHPAGMPKRVEAGPVSDLHGDLIGYNDIDTLGGNSGSGIVSSPQGRIVGVHTNGGCNAAMTGHNHGYRISSLLAASPTLTSIASHPPSHFKKLIDDPPTGFKKVADDPPRFKKLLDDPVGKPLLDPPKPLLDPPKGIFDPPKGLLDPPKAALDPRPGPLAPGAFDPAGFAASAAGQAPFVLATPHHAPHAGAEPPGLQPLQAALQRAQAELGRLQLLLQYLQAALAQTQQAGESPR